MKYVESINLSLHHIFQNYSNAIIIGEDIKDPYGGAFKVTKSLSDKYGDRVISTPISEASIVGLGVGMALNGHKPIVEIMFGDFITLCADQIINGAAKFPWMYGDKVTVPMIIRTPMGGRRGYGPTHSQSLESLFFNIPNINIYAPSIFNDPGQMLIEIFNNSDILSLFIENKISYPKKLIEISSSENNDGYIIEKESIDYGSEIITITLEKQNKPDVTIVTYGGMTEFCVKAMEVVYMEEEIVVEVISLSKIKPIEKEFISNKITNNMQRLLVVEEGCSAAGWSSMVLSQLNDYTHQSLLKPPSILGALNYPIGSAPSLENHILPDENDIIDSIIKLME